MSFKTNLFPIETTVIPAGNMSSPSEAFRLVLSEIPKGRVRMNKGAALREMLRNAANRDDDALSCQTCEHRRQLANNCICEYRDGNDSDGSDGECYC